jgi:hypothetical protein
VTSICFVSIFDDIVDFFEKDAHEFLVALLNILQAEFAQFYRLESAEVIYIFLFPRNDV